MSEHRSHVVVAFLICHTHAELSKTLHIFCAKSRSCYFYLKSHSTCKLLFILNNNISKATQ